MGRLSTNVPGDMQATPGADIDLVIRTRAYGTTLWKPGISACSVCLLYLPR